MMGKVDYFLLRAAIYLKLLFKYPASRQLTPRNIFPTTDEKFSNKSILVGATAATFRSVEINL